jgi:predicted nucleic-acid-binding protein
VKGLDTNVLVRFLTRDDPVQFDRARRALEGIESAGESARIDAIVLCELAWVLASGYGLDRAAIADALAGLLDAAAFDVDDRDLAREAVNRYRAGNGDFSDHLIGLRNQRAGCDRTLTFDRRLHRSPAFAPL